MMIINTLGHIIIDDEDTGYGVSQDADRTRCYHRQTGAYVDLPSERYSLAHIAPLSGVPGRGQFEQDFLAATR
ncbi:MAG: hypothetical protein ACOY5W_09240 [Pseudomonadota bacterium]